jgi:hypothetical protein
MTNLISRSGQPDFREILKEVAKPDPEKGDGRVPDGFPILNKRCKQISSRTSSRGRLPIYISEVNNESTVFCVQPARVVDQ